MLNSPKWHFLGRDDKTNVINCAGNLEGHIQDEGIYEEDADAGPVAKEEDEESRPVPIKDLEEPKLRQKRQTSSNMKDEDKEKADMESRKEQGGKREKQKWGGKGKKYDGGDDMEDENEKKSDWESVKQGQRKGKKNYKGKGSGMAEMGKLLEKGKEMLKKVKDMVPELMQKMKI
ncbi:hypothetical protein NDU88_000558 [Pleurodeles waltl]|uniref:Uncharacterized protein n=1 Tax=Pleurodeles waltl TaxID=8319 RepID=A0AAV7P8L6_PLEWA|nr:hypothetical protein NDU88_000558 [Pleurodeles waltl]